MHVQPTTSTPPRSRSSRSASRVPRRSHPQHRASSAGRARRRRIDCGRRGEFGRWCGRDHRSARPRCDGPMGLTDSEIAVVDGRDETGLRAGCALTGPHGEPLHPGRNGLVRAADAATHALLPGCRAARLRTRCSGAGLTRWSARQRRRLRSAVEDGGDWNVGIPASTSALVPGNRRA